MDIKKAGKIPALLFTFFSFLYHFKPPFRSA